MKKIQILISILILTSCSRPDEKFYFKKALHKNKNKEYSAAIKNLNKVLEIGNNKTYMIKAARTGLKIKNINPAQKIKFLRAIMLHTNNSKERRDSQREIANLYYETQNYKQAIYEFEKLSEKNLKIAQSYFHLNDMDQALIEVKKLENSNEDQFDLMVLKARIQASLSKLDEAIAIYTSLLNEDTSKSRTVLIELAQCYEQKKDYDKAILVLSDSDDEVIKSKLERLKISRDMQPGAKRINK